MRILIQKRKVILFLFLLGKFIDRFKNCFLTELGSKLRAIFNELWTDKSSDLFFNTDNWMEKDRYP